MMELRDLYWLAGWLEGEGSFTFNTGTKPYISNSPRISSVSTDRDVVNRAATIMNTHLLGPYNTIIPGKIRKPNWKTYANGALAAGWIMDRRLIYVVTYQWWGGVWRIPLSKGGEAARLKRLTSSRLDLTNATRQADNSYATRMTRAHARR